MSCGLMHIEPKAFAKYGSLRSEAARLKRLSKESVESFASFFQANDTKEKYSKSSGFGVISVTGLLVSERDVWADFFGVSQTSYSEIIEAVSALCSDDSVEDIYMDFNTPGGYNDGLAACMEVIANSSKPIHGRVDSMCCSAGYFLLSQCAAATAKTRASRIGSIGTVVEVTDWSEYESSVGIKTIKITNSNSSDKRPNLNSDEGVAVVRDELDDIQSVWDEMIVEGRSSAVNFSIENMHSLNGRTVTAKKAQSLGLIDAVGGAAVSVKNEKSNVNNSIESEGGNMDLMSLLSSNAEAKKEHDVLVESARAEGVKSAGSAAVDTALSGERGRIAALLSLGNVKLESTLTEAISSGASENEYKIACFDAGTNFQSSKPVEKNVPPVHAPRSASEEAKIVSETDDKTQQNIDNMYGSN